MHTNTINGVDVCWHKFNEFSFCFTGQVQSVATTEPTFVSCTKELTRQKEKLFERNLSNVYIKMFATFPSHRPVIE